VDYTEILLENGTKFGKFYFFSYNRENFKGFIDLL